MGPRFAGAASKIDNLVREAANKAIDTLPFRRRQPQAPNAPPLPPGLSSAQDFPPLAAPSQPPVVPKAQRKVTTRAATPNIKPVVPVVPSTSTSKMTSTNVQPSDDTAHLITDGASITVTAGRESNPDPNRPKMLAKAEGKMPDGGLADAASSTAQTKKPDALKIGDKKPRPENLTIQTAKDSSKTDRQVNAAANDEKVGNDAAFPPLALSQPATPSTMASQASAPASTRQPKSIRLSGIPKNDTPSPGIPPSLGSRQASRRPSLTSLNRPETPTSEKISDNASFTTTSLSRANSPPPSRVGSAPIRRVTKSQQKKERQTRAKEAEVVAVKKEEPATKVEEQVFQAPIIGRKKKTKKAKETSQAQTSKDSTPAVTRPASPEIPSPQKITQEEKPLPTGPGLPPAGIFKAPKAPKKNLQIAPDMPYQVETSSSIPPTPASAAADNPQAQNPPPAVTPASVYAAFKAEREQNLGSFEIDPYDLLLKPLYSSNSRFDQNLNPNLVHDGHTTPLNAEQIAKLDDGEPVAVNLDDKTAIVIFPDRRVLKGLDPTTAARYKELCMRVNRRHGATLNHAEQDTYIPCEIKNLMPSSNANIDTAPPPGDKLPSNTASISHLTSLRKKSIRTPLMNHFLQPTPLPTEPFPTPAFIAANLESILANRSFGARDTSTGGDQPPGVFSSSKAAGNSSNPLMGPSSGASLSVEEAEAQLLAERKNTEGLEKRLNALIRKNRRLMMGSGN